MTGSVFSLEVGTLVPGDAEPGESIQDDAGVLLGAALAIGILDPQHMGAAGMAGEQPVEQCRARAADMEVSCGGGCESNSRFHHGISKA
jgi:hypothetical protein